ncbi:hypothetical protein [Halarcobacter ebronensis]|uniref:Uncharacterized protein n=1 Tax=Halarcobacter ebronensis TaxID=1462615 RepID=A0A4Q1AS12_9BACT|nr:hypothetical protein [Halarcobacter ebronensis]QKF80623.1 hypothetical protein AEBR_0105 [Halarcobacter ebronensis]RXK08424.1 hypothetical protein CRV07_01070 [Halarcobacter ebronensis]
MHINRKVGGSKMTVQDKIKEQLLKEVFSNIDNIYDFMDTRFTLDKPCDDAIVKKLNELKDVVYKVSGLCELS